MPRLDIDELLKVAEDEGMSKEDATNMLWGMASLSDDKQAIARLQQLEIAKLNKRK